VRHVLRSLVVLAVPIIAVVIFLPASTGVRLLIALTAGACGLLFQMVHTIETTERRAIAAGYPPGTAEATRHQRAIAAQRAANERRRSRNGPRR
jgi:2-keto-3-deoxy-L-rhamnonate aldolase RhmA